MTIPLKIVTKGQAVAEMVPVYINGRGPFTFLLDTGSTISSVSQPVATALHLRRTGSTTRVKGVTSTTRVPLVRVRNWRLGRAALAPATVAVLGLTQTAGGVAGLLGSDELHRFGAVTIDFSRHQLRLARP